jgi:hypothetical protein
LDVITGAGGAAAAYCVACCHPAEGTDEGRASLGNRLETCLLTRWIGNFPISSIRYWKIVTAGIHKFPKNQGVTSCELMHTFVCEEKNRNNGAVNSRQTDTTIQNLVAWESICLPTQVYSYVVKCKLLQLSYRAG